MGKDTLLLVDPDERLDSVPTVRVGVGLGSSLARAILILAALSLALVLRFSLRDFQSNDFVAFTGPWLDYIQSHGGFRALRDDFADYNPAYLYLLTVSAYLFPGVFAGVDRVLAIKLIAIPFDFLNAFLVYRIVRLRRGGAGAFLAGLIALFLPTVVVNGSLWGQADAVYTSGLLACVYFLLIGRGSVALVAFGLALAIKLQAVFLAPLLVILLIRRVIPWWRFLVVPLVYAVTLVPAALVGRPVADLLTIYLRQTDRYTALTTFAPTIYGWLPADRHDLVYPLGLLALAALVTALVVFGVRARVSPRGGSGVNEQTVARGLVPRRDPSGSAASCRPPVMDGASPPDSSAVRAGGAATRPPSAGSLAMEPRARSALSSALTPDALIALATFSLLAVPFLAPRMHERYFYPADLLAFAFAFFFPRLFGVPIAIGLVSLVSYCPSLFEFEVLPLPYLTFVELLAVVTVGLHLARLTRAGSGLRPPLAPAAIALVALIGVPLAIRLPGVVAANAPALTTASELAALSNRTDLAYGDSLSLVGYGPARPQVGPDGRLRLDLYWRKHGWASDHHATSVQLLDHQGSKLAQSDHRQPPSPWPVHGVVRETREITIDTADAPFVGRIVVAAQAPGGEPLGARDRQGDSKGESVTVGQFKAPPPDLAISSVESGDCPAAGASLGGSFALAGCQLSARQVRAGDELSGTLVWRALAPVDVDYTAFVQLVGPNGLAGQYDSRPRSGGYPTDWWEPGEKIADSFATRVADVAPGEYRLIAGFYDLRDGRRLQQAGVDHLDLGPVLVVE